jgi:hypothetical protein
MVGRTGPEDTCTHHDDAHCLIPRSLFDHVQDLAGRPRACWLQDYTRQPRRQQSKLIGPAFLESSHAVATAAVAAKA